MSTGVQSLLGWAGQLERKTLVSDQNSGIRVGRVWAWMDQQRA